MVDDGDADCCELQQPQNQQNLRRGPIQIIMSSKHFRKRRRKRDKSYIDSIKVNQDQRFSSISMYALVSVSLYFILYSSNCVRANDSYPRLRLAEPRFRDKLSPNIQPYSTNSGVRQDPEVATSLVPLLNSVRSYPISNGDPLFNQQTNRERDKLLRKLSSTMILETIFNNKLPIDREINTRSNHLITQNASRWVNKTHISNEIRTKQAGRMLPNPKSEKINHFPLQMIVSSTNQTNTFSNEDPQEERTNETKTKDSFDQRSLSYLVDKLFDLNPNLSDVISRLPSTRPPLRPKLSNNIKINRPKLTLDMLIKDEYDSRVQPMIETLKSQQNLSNISPSRSTTKADILNHRLDDSITSSEATTSVSTSSSQFKISDGQVMTTATPSAKENNDEPSSDEDGPEDYEDSIDDESPDNPTIDRQAPETTISKTKKILRNVPPYQLANPVEKQFTSSKKESKDYDQPNVLTSSTSGSILIDGQQRRAFSARDRTAEKVVDSSARGSLVFSDGVDEAEKANRNKDSLNGKGIKFSPKLTTDKLGESFLLNQLFSTMNPLIDLNLKLGANTSGTNADIAHNPLIYKGYVGKDDYLITTTSSDWSKPLGNSRDTQTTNPYKYNQIITTTQTPPTEPPTVPYNYYLNQPVTNAQSVPAMVIPTSESPLEYTTTRPLIVTNSIVAPTKPPQNPSQVQGKSNFKEFVSPNDSIDPNVTVPVSDRKFSFQLPIDKNQTKLLHHSHRTTDRQSINLNSTKNHVSQIGQTQATHDGIDNNSRRKVSNTSSRLNEADRSWSPAKVQQHEKSPSQNHRQQQQHDMNVNHTNTLLVSVTNSSSPITFPFVEVKSKPSTYGSNVTKNTLLYKNQIEDLTEPVEQNKGESELSQAHDKERIKSRISTSGNKIDGKNQVDNHKDVLSDQQGNIDTINEDLTDQPKTSEEKVVHASDNNNNQDDGENEYETDEAHSRLSGKENSRTTTKKGVNINGKVRGFINTAEDRTRFKKINKFQGHEPASSDISLSGTDRIGHRHVSTQNQTNRYVKFHQPTRTSESIMVGEKIQPTNTLISSANPDASISSSGNVVGNHAIQTNSNFFGEASSETPMMEISTSLFNLENKNLRQSNRQRNIDAFNDPYQKTSSNTFLSTIQNPFSTTQASPTSPQLSASFTTPTTILKENSDKNATIRQTGDITKSTISESKSSSDRLAFILIGGSCVLSVVCLVLAAMSMRCQDMCDDYHSLRNAERAAMKLQKHRLKYTKNHQVNRSNHGRLSSAESGQSLIEDSNDDKGFEINVDDTDLHLARNLRSQTNAKSIQFSETIEKNNQPWQQTNGYQGPSNNQHHANDGHQICGCENCMSRRLRLHDYLMMGEKNLSWLHPYHQMQQHSRLQPLFGAGSSVNTFFPHNQALRSYSALAGAGNALDTSAFIDNQPVAHSCAIKRSKSFLSKSRNLQPHKHANQSFGHINCGMVDVECNNLNHEHAQHICHHYQHHVKCPNSNETTVSDESETTLNETLHCEKNHAHCSRDCTTRNTDNNRNRLKLMQIAKLNTQISNGWKKQHANQAKRISSGISDNHQSYHQQVATSTSSDSGTIRRCTCVKDHHHHHHHHNHLESVVHNRRSQLNHKSSHKRPGKHDPQQPQKRDKSMLVWSTNGDRLI